MNKKLIYGASSLMLLSGLGFTSCQSDNILSGDDNAKGSYILTVKASKGDDKTRTEFEEKDGNLISTWNAGDKLIVADINGVIGSVTLVSGEGTSDGVFEGDVKLTDETSALNLWYIQNKTLENGTKSYKYEIGKLENGTYVQDGTFGSMAANDVMSVHVSTNDNRLTIDSEKKIAEIEATMERRVAEAHFTLSFADNTVLDVNDVVTVSGSGVDKIVNFNLVSLATNSTPGDFEIKKATKDNDLYLTLLPHADVAATFTVVKNNKTYTGTLKTRDWVYGEYYRAAHEKGVEVEMVAGVDHSKNPLSKWAESDLRRVSGTDGSDSRNEFTGDYTITGSYYQFGRNKGWADDEEAATCYTVEVSLSPNNNVYDPFNAGTKLPRYQATSHTYSSYPQYFYIDPAHNGDYMVRNNDDWVARAERIGYDYANPCPEGYRIPKLADYIKILPTGGYDGYLTSFSEIKKFEEEGVTCAMQWNRKVISNNNYLEIKSLVVEDGFTDKDNVNWNDENVVVRYFKAAGCIMSSWHKYGLTTDYGTSYQFVATPLMLCQYSVGLGGSGNAGVVLYNVTRDDTKLGGYYWMADAEQYRFEFMFDPSNLRQQGSYVMAFAQSTPISVIKVQGVAPKAQPHAYNIRCIKE